MNFVCVDVGSTFTKAVAVSGKGELLGAADHRTTVESDVLVGLDAAVKKTGVQPDEVLVCSSAGGGLRLAVVGYERLVTAEAGHRVGLSAGAKVVHVAAGKLDAVALQGLRAAKPDVVLLVGGADGGDEETITHNANRLAKARWKTPIVVAGNVSARSDVERALAGLRVTVTGNVLPAIGVSNPGPARAAIREVFLSHVIGGKHLSRGPRFASMVRGATPDVVLTGVELLAQRVAGDLLVVDVGGATTDVYSVIKPVGEVADVAGTLWASRTVEGDLGMRWSARGVADAARAERLDDLGDVDIDPAAASHPLDERLAELAMTIALRRHARAGRDLSGVTFVIGSGGVLRHRPADAARKIVQSALADHAGGWALPRSPAVGIDSSYVLAAAGLLAADHPGAAVSLLGSALT
ncbi:glutamate mutase L [Allorhizocola rhizosphaerae]|uniref:glutamate mutase L n=1 Tax=Allorhizocola rhizosphaerae TaxID=1872709 RepID=UPI000E3C0B7D|nr:glutamate mutase L [Allorhizocola rhizosphaerae]